MRVYDAFEDRLSPLWVAKLVFELRKLANRLQVCERWSANPVAHVQDGQRTLALF